MAELMGARFEITWPEDGGPVRSTIGYTITTNIVEREKYVLDWRESFVLLVRVGADHKPALSIRDPRPPDVDRIITELPTTWLRIDKSSPSEIARSHEYTFTEVDLAKIAVSDRNRLYVYVHLIPDASDHEAIADARFSAPATVAWQGDIPRLVGEEPTLKTGGSDRALIRSLERQTDLLTRLATAPCDPDVLRVASAMSTEAAAFPRQNAPCAEDGEFTAALERHTNAVTQLLRSLQPTEQAQRRTQTLGEPDKLVAALERQTEILMKLAADAGTR